VKCRKVFPRTLFRPSSLPDPELRALYNHHYAERYAAGEFIECFDDDSHPSPARSRQPECTRSQYICVWSDDGATKLVGGHRYLLADGTIFGSHRLDPKYVYVEGVVYKQQPKPPGP
jgi:hypothetical protein